MAFREKHTVRVDSYITLDVRLAWKPLKNLELTLVGQNLAERWHREFVSLDSLSTQVQRGVYGKITWKRSAGTGYVPITRKFSRGFEEISVPQPARPFCSVA